jgi:hypothetical protein
MNASLMHQRVRCFLRLLFWLTSMVRPRPALSIAANLSKGLDAQSMASVADWLPNRGMSTIHGCPTGGGPSTAGGIRDVKLPPLSENFT